MANLILEPANICKCCTLKSDRKLCNIYNGTFNFTLCDVMNRVLGSIQRISPASSLSTQENEDWFDLRRLIHPS